MKKIAELELKVVNLKCQLMQADSVFNKTLDDDVELGAYRAIRPEGSIEGHASFISAIYERGSWLAFLLVFQSFSSIILVANEGLLAEHPNIIFFLTMLVGAGGNAGNQAAVRVIRGLAVGSITNRSRGKFLRSEVGMAVALSCSVGFVGFLRAMLSFRTTTLETMAITMALVSIIFISVLAGALLPFILQYFKFDPAHSSTTIQVQISRIPHLILSCFILGRYQVIMDILGVLITCAVATWILSLPLIAEVVVGEGASARGEVGKQAGSTTF